MTWIQTNTDHAFDLAAPCAADVYIEDIVWGLGSLPRYVGQGRHFYSVAEHSVLIAEYLARAGHSDQIVLGGLLHDSSEAYCGDPSAPLRRALPPEARDAMKALEHRVERAICEKLGVPFDLLHHAAVKDADTRILLDEKRTLFGPSPRPWAIADLEPLGVDLQCWPAAVARCAWFDAYKSLRFAMNHETWPKAEEGL